MARPIGATEHCRTQLVAVSHRAAIFRMFSDHDDGDEYGSSDFESVIQVANQRYARETRLTEEWDQRVRAAIEDDEASQLRRDTLEETRLQQQAANLADDDQAELHYFASLQRQTSFNSAIHTDDDDGETGAAEHSRRLAFGDDNWKSVDAGIA